MFKIAACQLYFLLRSFHLSRCERVMVSWTQWQWLTGKEINFQSLRLFFLALKLETEAGQWAFVCVLCTCRTWKTWCCQMEWWREISTWWDENTVASGSCMARMLLSSKCLSWPQLKRNGVLCDLGRDRFSEQTVVLKNGANCWRRLAIFLRSGRMVLGACAVMWKEKDVRAKWGRKILGRKGARKRRLWGRSNRKKELTKQNTLAYFKGPWILKLQEGYEKLEKNCLYFSTVH